MKQVMRASSGTFLGLFNMFSGGALEQLSIFALGIMPYISASIILQLLTVVVPALERLQKEGQQGQKKINQYTRYGTIVLSLVQSFFIARYFEGLNRTYGQYGTVVANPGLGFELMTMMSLTTGTAFIMWLGEQITERGIGNGISLIIFAGIVAGFPDAVVRLVQKSTSTGDRERVRAVHDPRHRHHRHRGDHLLRAAGNERSPSNTPSASSDGRCTAASRRTCRSRSTSPASFRRSSRRRS